MHKFQSGQTVLPFKGEIWNFVNGNQGSLLSENHAKLYCFQMSENLLTYSSGTMNLTENSDHVILFWLDILQFEKKKKLFILALGW